MRLSQGMSTHCTVNVEGFFVVYRHIYQAVTRVMHQKRNTTQSTLHKK